MFATKINLFFQRNTIFFKYLLLFTCAFFLPLSILFFYFAFQGQADYKEYLEETTTQILESISERLEMDLVNLTTMNVQLVSNRNFFSEHLATDYYEISLAQADLARYLTTNSVLQNVLYYNIASDTLFSATTTYTSPLNIIRTYPLDEESLAQLFSHIDEPSFDVYSFTTTDDVTYLYTCTAVPLYSKNPQGVLITLLSDSYFSSLSSSFLSESDLLTITNQYQEVVYTTLPQQIRTSSNSLELSSNEYMLISNNVPYYNLDLQIDVSTERLNQKAKETVLTYLYIGLPLLLIAGILIYAFTRISYRPLDSIISIVKNKEQEKKGVQLDLILTDLNNLVTEKERNIELKPFYQQMALQSVMHSLIAGQSLTKETINQQLEKLNCAIPLGKLAIAVIQIEHDSVLDHENEIYHYLAAQKSNHLFLNLCQAHNIVLLLPYDPLQIANCYFEIYCFIEHLQELYHVKPIVAISQPFNELQQFYHIYLRVISALDSHIVTAKNEDYRDIVFVHNTSPQDNFKNYPTDEIVSLDKALQQLNIALIRRLTQSCCEKVASPNISFFTAKCICFEVLNCFLKAGASLPLTEEIEWEQYNLSNISGFVRNAELVTMINDICDELCNKLNAPIKSTNDQKLIAAIDEYISLYALDSNFSIRTLGDHFSLSDKYISYLYKQKTNSNIIDIVSEIRLIAAKRLLTESNLSIKEIVQQIGYLDQSSFTKKFKNAEGCTPNEYRKSQLQSLVMSNNEP